MPAANKIPYFTMEPSLNIFSPKNWKGYYGDHGCVPLDTQQGVSMDRLAPGEEPPPSSKPSSSTPEQIKTEKATKTHQKSLEQSEDQQRTGLKQVSKESKDAETPDAEDCPKLPIFDLLDVPGAMEKMGWPVSAACSRKWFSSPKHIYNDKPNSVQPIDDTLITLDWALKFGNVKNKYNELLSHTIYLEDAVFLAKKFVRRKLNEMFVEQGLIKFDFNTTTEIKDLRQFHIDW